MQNVLTIAGSDSLAGGGLQADLKTFEELNTFGLSAITSVVSIMPTAVTVSLMKPEVLNQQLTAIFSRVPIRIIKTGLLGDVEMIRVVHAQLSQRSVPLVIDPVLTFKEGGEYTQQDYVRMMKRQLLPLGTVVTPNLAEAQALSGMFLNRAEQLPEAAQRIQHLGCPNVVIKGGSRLAGTDAIDYLRMGDQDYWFMEPKLKTPRTDGAGCTFSAAITALLAQGHPLPVAVSRAKTFVRSAIRDSVVIDERLGSVYQGSLRRREKQHAKK
ncbi:bifunctional hydroxymethylpyrimidine kinase/phosphomethylpyrimidine kinase [Levilactobacillus spicheri]|uniref:pyridoxal kinase n=1 Tax=Levilactobacillus spicheri TaxID=216463 RepID=A0A0F3RSZ6_9LACO|nr:bifunctional hydroxymethylpyrimidine kinase/phosphomethylpyrimidine kinase [Levilactobacillus spicheri]KJW12734.1 hydrogenase expression protein [Levilactobacillus spicheri]